MIVNRLARYLAADDGLVQVYARACREAGATIHETRSGAELDAVCQHLAARGTDCVVLAGGDGSYMAGTSALVRSFGERLPTLAFAPGGTASTVARNWGFHGRREDYARRLVAAAAEGGTVTARPTLRLLDDTGREAVGFIFGAGLVASFFEAYYASPVQGYAGAAILVARIFAGSFVGGDLARRVLEPVAMSLAIDGETCGARAFSLVAASVVHDLGLHMILLHRAAEDHPGRVHVVASPLGARALGPQLPRVLSGRPLRGEGHVDALARELVLRFPEPRLVGSYVLDGELLRAREVRVSAGPTIGHLAG